MKRVTGIGGIFFKAENPELLKEWYRKHLGLPVNEWGASFIWKDDDLPSGTGRTEWSIFKKDSKYLDPSVQPFMINYRVENLLELLKVLKEEGVTIVNEPEISEYGKFGWIMDPEGNKIELWEPPRN